MKTINIDGKKPSYLLNALKNFNKVFKKYVTYDNFKTHKKPGLHCFSRKYIFWKTAGRGRQLKLTSKAF